MKKQGCLENEKKGSSDQWRSRRTPPLPFEHHHARRGVGEKGYEDNTVERLKMNRKDFYFFFFFSKYKANVNNDTHVE